MLNYQNEKTNNAPCIVVPDGPVLMPQVLATDIPTPGSGAVLHTNASNQLVGTTARGGEALCELPMFDPCAYGAVGDGTTDDTAALETCFTAAGATGSVYLRPGKTFKVTADKSWSCGRLVSDGGCFTVVNTKTLTLTALEIVAPLTVQLFKGQGTVALTVSRGTIASWWWWGAEVTTTDATKTLAMLFNVPAQKMASAIVKTRARRTGGSRGTGAVGDAASFQRRAAFKHDATAPYAISLVSAEQTIGTDIASTDLGAGQAAIAVATEKGTGDQAIKHSVTGAANLNLSWNVLVELDTV